MLKFYGYKKCSTCRKAEKKLEELGIKYEFNDITQNPPDEKTLRNIIKNSGLEIKKAFNTSGVQYKSENWKEKIKNLDSEGMIKALVGKGKLMKRPMLINGNKATIGFQEDLFISIWETSTKS